MSRKKASAAIERPRGGGSYIRRPDGKLEQVHGTERPEPFAPPPAADTAADQTTGDAGEPEQEG